MHTSESNPHPAVSLSRPKESAGPIPSLIAPSGIFRLQHALAIPAAVACLILSGTATAQAEAPSPDAIPEGTSSLAYFDEDGQLVQSRTDEFDDPLLLDYSYAGYHFGERGIPDTEGPVFDVTDYGAVPDDGSNDAAAIQRAIDAAEEAGGGVVFFPPGIFHVNTQPGDPDTLTVASSGIVLRGSGATEGGTVVFKVHRGPWLVRFRSPDHGLGGVLTGIEGEIPRNGRTFTVEDPSDLAEGRWVAVEANNRSAVADFFIGDRSIPGSWSRIRDRGVPIQELHQIESIDGNRVTLHAPVTLRMQESFAPRLRAFNPIEEIGVEDIAFMGNWLGHFVHHRSSFDDYHFQAVRFLSVANSWLRRCAFINLNEATNQDTTANMTLKHIRLAGTGGHTATMQNRATHNLTALSADESDGYWHNIGWRASTAGAVFWRFDMHPIMPLDMHGMYPYSSLMDAMSGGYIMDSGGPSASFPHHGPGFVLWNFNYLDGATPEQRSTGNRSTTIDFWTTRPWVIDPIVVGLHGAAEEVGVNPDSMLVMESLGQPVEPESLYEAQLADRLGGLPEWAVEAKTFWDTYRDEPLPGFIHPVRGRTDVVHHYPLDLELDFLVEELQALKQTQPNPNDFEVRSISDGAFRTDFMNVKTIMHNVLSYMHSFSVPFGEWQLYADPSEEGGTVTIEVREDGDRRTLVMLAEYALEEPEGYYDMFPDQDIVYRKYLGDNQAQQWDAAEEMVRALGGTIEKRNTSGGSEVRIEIPEMDPS